MKGKIDQLILKFVELIKTDWFYGRQAPEYYSSISRFRSTAFQHFHILVSKSRSVSNEDRGQVEDVLVQVWKTAF